MKKAVLKTITVLSILIMTSISAQSQSATSFTVTDIDNDTVRQKIDAGVSALLTEFNSAFFGNRTPELNKIAGLTKNCKRTIEYMWEITQFRCVETELEERGLQTPTGYQVRHIPVFLKDVPEEEAYREIVINFDPQGNVEDIYFPVVHYGPFVSIRSESSESSEGKDVSDLRRRRAILNFIEKFHTAYISKDIDLLERVYGKAGAEGKKYIRGLSNIFKQSNPMIKVIIDDVELKQHPKHESIYGLSLKHGWTTKHYSDTGHLFIMFNCMPDDRIEVIHAVWQQEKIDEQQLWESMSVK